MKPMDYAKALLIAAILLALNVAISFGAVWIYSVAIEPGHDEAFYQAQALKIAPVSGMIGGFVLVFAAAWFFAKRRPARSHYAFGLALAAGYAAIDVIIVLAAAPDAFAEYPAQFAVSYASKFVAAIAGAALVRKKDVRL